MPGHRVQAHGLVSRGTAVLTQAQKGGPAALCRGAAARLSQIFPQGLQVLLHQRYVGGARLQICGGYVVAGVEHGSPDPCGLSDAVRHQVVGKLDIPDGGDVLLAHLVGQKGDGGRRGLRLGAAAGKGGVVVDVEFLGEIPQGNRSPNTMVRSPAPAKKSANSWSSFSIRAA